MLFDNSRYFEIWQWLWWSLENCPKDYIKLFWSSLSWTNCYNKTKNGCSRPVLFSISFQLRNWRKLGKSSANLDFGLDGISKICHWRSPTLVKNNSSVPVRQLFFELWSFGSPKLSEVRCFKISLDHNMSSKSS